MSSNGNSGGVGVGGLLLVAFIVMKLAGVIDWSWWWVLSPMWIGAAVAAAVIPVALLLIAYSRGRVKLTWRGRR